jgi:hypothetical protein
MLEYVHDMVVMGNFSPANCINFCIVIFKGVI